MRLRNVRAHRMGEMCARAKHTGNPLALSLHDFRMVIFVYIHRGPKFAIQVKSKEMLRVEIKKKKKKNHEKRDCTERDRFEGNLVPYGYYL